MVVVLVGRFRKQRRRKKKNINSPSTTTTQLSTDYYIGLVRVFVSSQRQQQRDEGHCKRRWGRVKGYGRFT